MTQGGMGPILRQVPRTQVGFKFSGIRSQVILNKCFNFSNGPDKTQMMLQFPRYILVRSF